MSPSKRPWKMSPSKQAIDDADGNTVAILGTNFISKDIFKSNMAMLINAPLMLDLLCEILIMEEDILGKDFSKRAEAILKSVFGEHENNK